MAAADQEFLDALKYLGQQGQAFGISQQMNDVNKRADEIRSTMTDEIQRRQALQNLAQQATIRVSGSGGNAQQLAAINNLIPPIPTTVQDAYLRGTMTGDKQMVDVAKQMQNEDQNRQIQLLQKKGAIELMIEKQKEAGKNNPMTMQVMKENRKKYDDLMSGRQKAVETMSRLNDIQKMLQKPSLISDSGPVDHYINGLTDYGQELRQKIGGVSLENMVTMFHGMSSAIRTESEQKYFQSTQLSDKNYPKVNLDYIDGQKKALKEIIRKADTAAYSFKNTNGLSFDAFDSAPVQAGAGYNKTPPAGAAKSFFKPASDK